MAKRGVASAPRGNHLKESTTGTNVRFLPRGAGERMTQTRETQFQTGFAECAKSDVSRVKNLDFKIKMVVGDGCKNGGPFLVNEPSNAAF